MIKTKFGRTFTAGQPSDVKIGNLYHFHDERHDRRENIKVLFSVTPSFFNDERNFGWNYITEVSFEEVAEPVASTQPKVIHTSRNTVTVDGVHYDKR